MVTFCIAFHPKFDLRSNFPFPSQRAGWVMQDPLTGLCPRIAVYASDTANQLVQEAGFKSFVELIAPFGLNIKGKIRLRGGTSRQGAATLVDKFPVYFCRPNSKTILNPDCLDDDTIRTAINPDIERAQDHASVSTSDTAETDLQSHTYNAYLSCLVGTAPLSPHETIAHPMAGLVAISTRDEDPVAKLTALSRSGRDPSLPHYVDTEFVRYYVLIHDCNNDDDKVSSTKLEAMRRTFGLNCQMLKIHSQQPDSSSGDGRRLPEISCIYDNQSSPDAPPREFILTEDFTAIEVFVKDLVVQSFIPVLERTTVSINENIAAARRGLTNRLFSASRRLLGTSKSSASLHGANNSNGNSNYNSQTMSYPASSPEAQLRRMADIAFFLHDYRLTYETCELLKKDFLNDKAWKYLAGVQEMGAISFLVASPPIASSPQVLKDTVDSLVDSAVYSYMYRCSCPGYALRTILICAELLRRKGGTAVDISTKWLTKALQEGLVGRFGRPLVMERISLDHSEYRNGIATKGRLRKSALWTLLASREWDTLEMPLQLQICLDECANVYDPLPWAVQEGSLYSDLRQDLASLKAVHKE